MGKEIWKNKEERAERALPGADEIHVGLVGKQILTTLPYFVGIVSTVTLNYF